MAGKKWAHGSPNTIAQLFGAKEIDKLLSSNIVVGPDEVMVLIEDGKITNTYTQTKVSQVLGTMGDKFKRLFGKGKDVEVLFADTSEKKIFLHFGQEYDLKPYTIDDDLVSGNLAVLFSIDRSNIANLYSQVANKPDMAITTRDIRILVQNEIATRVLKPTIKEFSTEDIGKRTTIKKIENECLREIGRVFELYAIEPVRFTISFDLTAIDHVKMATRERELSGKLETGTYEKEIVKAEEISEIDDWKKDKIAEREKKRMRRDIDLDKEARVLSHERKLEQEDFRHWEEQQAYDHRVEVEKRKERDRIDMEDEITTAELDKKRKITDSELDIQSRVHDTKLEGKLKEAHTDSKVRELEFDQDMIEMQGLMQIKAQKDKLKMERTEHDTQMRVAEFQGTKLKERELEAQEKISMAQSQAEGQKYNLDVYERALDRAERKSDRDLSHIANIVSSSRQNVPHTLVQGASETSAKVDVRESGTKKNECQQCGGLVDEDTRFCPHCGEKMI
ncbi:MAG: hypothetical protein ACMUIE_09235 [Thermoplasmatota archaeon]